MASAERSNEFVHVGTSRSRAKRGTFHCPVCARPAPFELVVVRSGVQIAGMPLLSWGRAAEYVECKACRCTYLSDILRPEAAGWGLRPLHLETALRVMVLMVVADGAIQGSEIEMVRAVYREIGGEELRPSAILTQVEHAKADGRDVSQFLESEGLLLNDTGKLAVVRSAWRVANADGEFHGAERALLVQIIKLLGCDPAEVWRVLGVTFMHA